MTPLNLKRLTNWMAGLCLATLSGIALGDAATEAMEIEQYGVYLKTRSGYQSLPPVRGLDSLNYDFSSRLLTLPVARDAVQPLEIVIHSPDFHPDWSRFEARPMHTPGGNAVVYPSITPLADDRFKLTFDEVTTDDRTLLLDTGCCRANVFAVNLSDPEPRLLELFAPETDHNPVSAEFVLGRILSRVDGSEELNALHEHWQTQVQIKEASDYFVYIDEAWRSYQDGETTGDRIDALQRVRDMAERYIEDFPQGQELEVVKEWLVVANTKLDV